MSKSSKWVPLEASPDIFNEWANSLGLPDSPLSFQDLFSLDEDFLSFIPQPVKAVLLLFPESKELEAERRKEGEEGPQWEGDSVWWIKQTIGNACGSIGLLHALMNLPESGEYSLKPDSPLMQFKKTSLPLNKKARAKLLEESDFFSNAHTTLATAGQSAIPEDLEHVTNHFICFVAAPNAKGENRVVELDGSREAPFDRGECTSLLHDVAQVVKDKYIARAGDDINFNMIVLAGERED